MCKLNRASIAVCTGFVRKDHWQRHDFSMRLCFKIQYCTVLYCTVLYSMCCIDPARNLMTLIGGAGTRPSVGAKSVRRRES